MRYCEQCGIQLSGTPERCPLCQGPLAGEPGEPSYPRVSPAPHRRAMRRVALAAVAAGTICGAVNLSVPESGWWSLFVIAGLATSWLLLWAAVRKQGSPAKAILWQLGIICALALLWDWCTGFHGWSVDFVVPIFIPCMQLAMAVTAWAMRLRKGEYLFFLILSLAAGLLPLISLGCGLLRVVYPSVICGGISIVGLAALVLFRGSELREEIARRIHL